MEYCCMSSAQRLVSHVNRRFLLAAFAMLAILIAALPLATSKAQSSNVVIQLVVPSQQRDAFSDQMIQDFQTAHPGITVKIMGHRRFGEDVTTHITRPTRQTTYALLDTSENRRALPALKGYPPATLTLNARRSI